MLSFPSPWSAPSHDIVLSCPAAPPGVPPDPYGVYDPGPVKSAFIATGWATLAVVLAIVLLCYLATRMSTGPRFQVRWWWCLGWSALASFLIPFIVLRPWPTRALPGSCENSPDAFAAALPWDVVVDRALTGLLWGVLLFVVLSLILTRVVGKSSWGGGFFHNRGVPYPRILPGD